MPGGRRSACRAKAARCCFIPGRNGPPNRTRASSATSPAHLIPSIITISRRSGTLLEGTFKIGGQLVTKGSMIFHPDPHFEGELLTETGGEMLFVQYAGPTTGGRPIYDGRFNIETRKPVAEERTDI